MSTNRKYNILHAVATLGAGGAELRLIDYLRVADRERFSHHVVCVTRFDRYKDAVKDLGIPVYDTGRRFRYDIRVPFRLAEIMRRQSIDLVHARNSTANMWAGLAARIAGVDHFVAGEHGTAWTETFGMRTVDRLLSGGRSCTMAVSAAAMAAAERIGITGQSEKIIVPDPVDVDKYAAISPDPTDGTMLYPERNNREGDFANGQRAGASAEMKRKQRSDLRRELGLSPSDMIVTILGRVVGTKGHAFAIQAMKHLPDDVYLVIAGTGALIKRLKKCAEDLEVYSRVFFVGFRDDVASVLAGSDILLAPSIHDTRSGAVTEAMAAGLPVVATNVDGFPELIEHGVTGLLVPAEAEIPNWSKDATVPKNVYDPDSKMFVKSKGPSPQALADSVLELLRDEQRRAQMGAAGREKVRREMSLEHVARSIEDVYLKLLESCSG